MRLKTKAIATFATIFATCCGTPTAHAAIDSFSPEEQKVIESLTTLTREPHGSVFSPPSDWMIADPSQLPASVRIMAVGKGSKEFPPSLNLASEKFNGSLKDYHKVVKEINKSQGFQWKSLGTLDTTSGTASLSQADTVNEWGQIRLLHAILLKDGVVHLMTGAALKEEFPHFRQTFINAMKTLHVNPSAVEMVSDATRKTKLLEARESVRNNWKETVASNSNTHDAFNEKQFQNSTWKPFTDLLASDFSDMDECWQNAVINDLLDELFESGCSES